MTRNSWIAMIVGVAVAALVMGGLAIASGGGSGSGGTGQPGPEEAVVTDTTDTTTTTTTTGTAAVNSAGSSTITPDSGIGNGTANNINYGDSDVCGNGT